MPRVNMRPFFNLSISWLSSSVLGVLLIATLWAGIGAKYVDNRASDVSGAQRDNENFALLFEENVLRSIGEMDKALLYLRRLLQNTKGTIDFPAAVGTTDILSELIVQVAIIDERGIMRASNVGPQPAPATDLSDREHFLFHLKSAEDKLFISKPLIGRASGKWSVQLTRRFHKPDGAFGGVIVASFNPEHFAKFYGRINLGLGAAFTLVGIDGVVRATGGNAETKYALGQDLRGTELMARVAADVSGSYRDESRKSGAPRLSAVRRVAGHPLAVNVSVPEQSILRESQANLHLMIFAGVALSLMIAAVTWQARKSELAVQRNSRQLRLTLAHMSQGIIMVTKDMSIPIINAKCVELLNLPREFLSSPPRFDELIAFLDRRGEYAKMALPDNLGPLEFYGPQDAAGQFELYERVRPDGTVLEVRSARLDDGGFVRTFSDITRRKQAQMEADRLASEDVLTGLANRRVLSETLDELTLAHCLSDPKAIERFTILCLDLDRFKAVNDAHGHAVGDKLLQAVAQRMKQMTRGTDLVARLGGDEFAVLLASGEQQPTAEAVACRLVEALSRPYELDGHQILIGASIGIAVGPADGRTTNELLIAADLALYAAKAAGRGTYRFFDRQMNEEIKGRRQIETDLRDAITRGQLELYYQPIINLRQNTISGFEALARWIHPIDGPIPPDKFIPIAEDSGLILPLGEWALREACSQAILWPDNVSVAVNLSPLQFASPGLAVMVERVLGETGLAPQRLELEITEGLLMRNTEATIATLHRLKDIGLRIAMDDFGTGYSSLSYLQSFPFDRIKVDRSFVSQLGANSTSSTVVRAVVDIATSRGMQTTAEGVETKEQRAALEALGCDEAQGYLLGRPVPVEQVATLIATWSKEDRKAA